MSLSPPSLTGFATLPMVWLIATIAAFQLGVWFNRLCGCKPIVNPVLIAMSLLIAALLALDVDYDTYLDEGGGLVAAVLGPATVALAVPLYGAARQVSRAMLPLFCGVMAGGIAAATSAIGLAWALGAPDEVLRTLAVKSVTAPIAMGVADQIGGVASLAAAFAVLTGVAGTIMSTWVMRRAGVESWEVTGAATGVTAHGQGTARMLSLDETAGAFASVGMGLNALLTAIWLPTFVAVAFD